VLGGSAGFSPDFVCTDVGLGLVVVFVTSGSLSYFGSLVLPIRSVMAIGTFVNRGFGS
jgi:hypothetical protein